MNILIIRFSSLGDLVTLEPTFRAIRYFFTDANIIFLTTGVGKGLYQDSNYFDEYVIYKNIYSKKLLKEKKFDLVINLQCNKPSHFISIFLNKKVYVNKSHTLLHKILGLKAKSKSIKQIIESTNLVRQDVIDKYFQESKEFINIPTQKQNFLNKEISKKYIAISTGTSERWLSKKWGVNNYLNLIKKLLEDNYKILLIGSNLEIEDEKYIIENLNNENIISYVNKTNLTQLKNLLSEVDLYIGNDSGPSHIAAGVGTNTITIFGSTDIKHCVKFMPYYGVHEYLKPKENVKCSPCYKTKCPTNMECMSSINVSEVILKIKEILDV